MGEFLQTNLDALHPVTREVIAQGTSASAVDYFRAEYRLAALRREAEAAFAGFDVLVAPTAPRIYSRSEVELDPFDTNAKLGTFTNFVNLLDLCAVAIPADPTPAGLPFGVTLMSRAGADYALLNGAAELRGEGVERVPGTTLLAVCGAHMTGEPMNGTLTARGGYRVSTTRTAPAYRLYALPDGVRPALVRCDGGASVEVEVWSLPAREIGGFLAGVAPPLALGSVQLDDGTWVNGFVGEGAATVDAADITRFGGWRHYRRAVSTMR